MKSSRLSARARNADVYDALDQTVRERFCRSWWCEWRPRFPPLLEGETPQTDKLTLACLFGVYSQSKVFLILSHKIVTLYKMCGEQNWKLCINLSNALLGSIFLFLFSFKLITYTVLHYSSVILIIFSKVHTVEYHTVAIIVNDTQRVSHQLLLLWDLYLQKNMTQDMKTLILHEYV